MPDIKPPTAKQLASAKKARGENEEILNHGYDVIVTDLIGEDAGKDFVEDQPELPLEGNK